MSNLGQYSVVDETTLDWITKKEVAISRAKEKAALEIAQGFEAPVKVMIVQCVAVETVDISSSTEHLDTK